MSGSGSNRGPTVGQPWANPEPRHLFRRVLSRNVSVAAFATRAWNKNMRSDAFTKDGAMPAQHCQASRCNRFVRAGAVFCSRHQDGGETTAVPTPKPSPETSATRLDPVEPIRFQERLEARSYKALYDDPIANVMHQAAAMVAEQGLLDELGALRIVLARLVMEEQDLSRLAANVTRVAHVAVQAARAQRVISGAAAEGLTNALTQVLIEVNSDGE